MKHTKGTWKFNGRDIVVGQNIGQQRICTIIEHRDEFKEEDEANAKLIAAAPDLLSACEYTIEKLRAIKGKTFNNSPIIFAMLKATQ